MRPAAGPRRAVTKLKCVVSLSGFDSRLRFRSHSRASLRARFARHLSSETRYSGGRAHRCVRGPGRCAEPRAGSSRAGRGAPGRPRRTRDADGRDARAAWSASRDRARGHDTHRSCTTVTSGRAATADALRASSDDPTPEPRLLTLGGCVWCTRTPIFHDRTRHCHVPTACGRPRSRITS